MGDQRPHGDAPLDGGHERLFQRLEVEPENDDVDRLLRALDRLDQSCCAVGRQNDKVHNRLRGGVSGTRFVSVATVETSPAKSWPISTIRGRTMKIRMQILVMVAVAAALGISAGAVAQQSSSLSDGLREFQKQLDVYLKLRSDLSSKLKPLSTTPDSVELSARQEALAAALKTARAGAKQGNIVNPAVAAHITRI